MLLMPANGLLLLLLLLLPAEGHADAADALLLMLLRLLQLLQLRAVLVARHYGTPEGAAGREALQLQVAPAVCCRGQALPLLREFKSRGLAGAHVLPARSQAAVAAKSWNLTRGACERRARAAATWQPSLRALR